MRLTPPDPAVLSDQMEALWAHPGPPFIRNSRSSLQRIVEKALADRGHGQMEAPEFDAAWTSVVVDSDLSIRPCFFLEQQGNARQGLVAGMEQGRDRRRSLQIKQEPACERCVCWARLS